jgi:hypothetical protein
LNLCEILDYGPLPFRFNPFWINYQEMYDLVEATRKSWISVTRVLSRIKNSQVCS